VPIIHFHSYIDSTAPYFGGFSDAPNINFEFPSVDSTMQLISTHYNCALKMDTVFSQPNSYDHFRFSFCQDEAEIELYVSRDGGHTWPGGQALPGMQVTQHFDASALMWDFFMNYSL
jgi:polyhydroxybutyrate depolymerase